MLNKSLKKCSEEASEALRLRVAVLFIAEDVIIIDILGNK